jgi:Mce-associated membrane protein
MSNTSNRLLLAAVVLLACLAVAGGVLAVGSHRDRDRYADRTVEQERYGEVLDVSRDFATALMNRDYQAFDDWTSGVEALSTGTFLEQFSADADRAMAQAEQLQEVRTGEVQSAAVSSVDPDSAVVLVATTGTTTRSAPSEQEVQANYRFLLTLALVDGAWRVSNSEPVG